MSRHLNYLLKQLEHTVYFTRDFVYLALVTRLGTTTKSLVAVRTSKDIQQQRCSSSNPLISIIPPNMRPSTFQSLFRAPNASISNTQTTLLRSPRPFLPNRIPTPQLRTSPFSSTTQLQRRTKGGDDVDPRISTFFPSSISSFVLHPLLQFLIYEALHKCPMLTWETQHSSAPISTKPATRDLFGFHGLASCATGRSIAPGCCSYGSGAGPRNASSRDNIWRCVQRASI